MAHIRDSGATSSTFRQGGILRRQNAEYRGHLVRSSWMPGRSGPRQQGVGAAGPRPPPEPMAGRVLCLHPTEQRPDPQRESLGRRPPARLSATSHLDNTLAAISGGPPSWVLARRFATRDPTALGNTATAIDLTGWMASIPSTIYSVSTGECAFSMAMARRHSIARPILLRSSLQGRNPSLIS